MNITSARFLKNVYKALTFMQYGLRSGMEEKDLQPIMMILTLCEREVFVTAMPVMGCEYEEVRIASRILATRARTCYIQCHA